MPLLTFLRSFQTNKRKENVILGNFRNIKLIAWYTYRANTK